MYQQLGKELRKRGDDDGAHSAYEQATMIDPADPWSHLYLGNSFYGKGAYGEALEQFQIARRLVPDLSIAHICIADTYQCLGQITLADEHYQRAVQLEPDDPIAQRNLARWQKIKKGLEEGCD